MQTVPDFDSMEINAKLINLDRSIYDKLEKDLLIMIPKLNAQNWYMPVAYTPHDYDHHVKRVLQYASHLLKDALEFDLFSKEELQVLQYACILHDIDMVYNPEGREIHSANAQIILNPYSAEDIIEQIAKEEAKKQSKAGEEKNQHIDKSLANAKKAINDIFIKPDPQKAEKQKATEQVHTYLMNAIAFLISDEDLRDAIGQVIIGHSDIKKSEELRINTLNDGFYQDVVINDKHIKTQILAAILRLADELDCSKQRRNDIEPAKIDRIIASEPKARKYWERLNLITTVDFEMPDIKIKVNSRPFREPANQYTYFKWLKEVYDKILQEYDVVNNVLTAKKVKFQINKPQLIFNNDSLEKEYEDYCSRKREDEQKKNKLNTDIDLDDLKGRIQTAISEKNLLYEVHRIYEQEGASPARGIRNYLDCNGLLIDNSILNDVAKAFVNFIYNGSFEDAPLESIKKDSFLVGVANSGVLIASRIELMTGIPSLYYVPADKEGRVSEQEMNWEEYSEYYKDKKAILVLGVNVSGKAISGAQEFLKRNLKSETDIPVEAIVGIINRDIQDKNRIINMFEHQGTKVGFILKGYPVDWCKYAANKTTCPYEDQCGIKRKSN